MQKFIYKLVQIILNKRAAHTQKLIDKLTNSFSVGANKTVFQNGAELILNSETEISKQKIEKEIKSIVKENLENPVKLYDYIKDNGTDVYCFKNADKVLNLIGEETGFFAPMQGIKAFWINLYINFAAHKKLVISFKSPEMFIVTSEPDIYNTLHQFHMWFGYKEGLPGFDSKDIENFKRIYKTASNEDISKLSMGEIISLQETIARDKEAIDFVVEITKEFESAKKLVNKIKQGQSVKL